MHPQVGMKSSMLCALERRIIVAHNDSGASLAFFTKSGNSKSFSSNAK